MCGAADWQPLADSVYCCRAAVALAPTTTAAGAIWGNLGALLMSAGRLQEAVEALDRSLRDSVELQSSVHYSGRCTVPASPVQPYCTAR